MEVLAMDELEGRGMGQKGSDLAADDYIAKQLESYGLQPAGDDRTFFKVPMVGVKTLPQTTFELARDGGERRR
jgi:hypothetical protein